MHHVYLLLERLPNVKLDKLGLKYITIRKSQASLETTPTGSSWLGAESGSSVSILIPLHEENTHETRIKACSKFLLRGKVHAWIPWRILGFRSGNMFSRQEIEDEQDWQNSCSVKTILQHSVKIWKQSLLIVDLSMIKKVYENFDHEWFCTTPCFLGPRTTRHIRQPTQCVR